MPDIDPLLEKHDAEQVQVPQGVEDVVMRQYASPTGEEQEESSYYHDENPRADQQNQPDHGQAPDQEQVEEPQTTHQQRGFTDISTEELQLAAQLSQGLASHNLPMEDSSMMDPNQDPSLEQVMEHHGLEEHEIAQHEHDLAQHEQDFQHHETQPHQDQMRQHNTQQQQEETYDPPQPQQQHDQPLQQHETQQQPQQHDEPYGPPPAQYIEQQQHHHHQQQQQQQPLQPHLQPAASMNHLPTHFQQPPSDNTPPRKRSKVSRACDECRRKKVKCDAPSETGDEPCSNCRRSNIRCLFSRVPQKRGPSKGYIKELADRIHSIEGKLASEGGNVDSLTELLTGSRRESSHEFTPTGQTDDNSRKRPYSSISGGEFGTPSRQQTWGSDTRAIQPYQTPGSKPSYSANGLAPTPVVSKELDTPSQPTASMEGLSLEINGISQGREVDEAAFNGYLHIIHPYFPLLANSKSRVDTTLAQCPRLLREAFIEALYGAIQSFPSFTAPYTNGDIASATQMVMGWDSTAVNRSYTMNLVQLQTLILIAIATDNFGPSSLKGEHGGARKSSLLGYARPVAIEMGLHLAHFNANVDCEFDLDAEENVAIRAWWSLVMLDRWSAISTATPISIPNNSAVIIPKLNILLGENAYQLASLAEILGHFQTAAITPPKTLQEPYAVNPLFNLSMELFRRQLPSNFTPTSHPLLHLAYWHCRIIAYLFQTDSKSSELLWACKESVSLLMANSQLISAFNHHFFCLTTSALLELAKIESTKEESSFCLKELLDSNLAPSTWDATIRDRIAEQIRPTTAQTNMEATASQSLQHLADLATATELDALKGEKGVVEAITQRVPADYNDLGFDPRPLLRSGYLNIFAELRPFTGMR